MRPRMCDCREVRGGAPHGHEAGFVAVFPPYYEVPRLFHPRRKVTCAKCKRRVWGKMDYHEGDYWYVLPPHKVKAWWRKSKKEARP